MVDQEARRKYAELVRQFISGRMTNDEYEANYEAIVHNESDIAIGAIYHDLWFCYDDLKTHRLIGGYRIDREDRRTIAKAVLFLQLDQEYQWPDDTWIGTSRALLLWTGAWATVIFLGMFPANYLLILGISFPAALLMLCYLGIRIPIERRAWKAHRDTEAWPFPRQADLAEAVRHPRLLNGSRTMP